MRHRRNEQHHIDNYELWRNTQVAEAPVSGMACSTDLGNFCKDGIIVTVCCQGFDILDMTGSKTFCPKFIPASAVVRHFSDVDCCVKCLLVHVSKH